MIEDINGREIMINREKIRKVTNNFDDKIETPSISQEGRENENKNTKYKEW